MNRFLLVATSGYEDTDLQKAYRLQECVVGLFEGRTCSPLLAEIGQRYTPKIQASKLTERSAFYPSNIVCLTWTCFNVLPQIPGQNVSSITYQTSSTFDSTESPTTTAACSNVSRPRSHLDHNYKHEHPQNSAISSRIGITWKILELGRGTQLLPLFRSFV
jgi:hypothetical protein